MPFSLSISAQAIIALFIFLAGLGLGIYVTRGIEQSKYEALELQYQKAEIAAVKQGKEDQQALDKLAVDSSQQEASAQANLAAKAQKQLAEVSKHVKSQPNTCITYGLVRVLDAAVHGVLADALNLPAGQSDDACTKISAADLANSVVINYNNANANAEQLNSIVAYLKRIQAQQEQWKNRH